MKLSNYSSSHRHELGELILSELGTLENPYALFDDSGRLRYGNSQFFKMFGKESADTNIFVLLNNKLGIQNFSKSFVKDGVESLCIGIMQLDGQHPTTFRVLGSKIRHNRKILYQCVISQIRSMIALQLGVPGRGESRPGAVHQRDNWLYATVRQAEDDGAGETGWYDPAPKKRKEDAMRKFMNAFHWENVLMVLYALCIGAALVLLACEKYMMRAFK